MFSLAGYTKIKSLISDALNQRTQLLDNILKKVSKISTEYLHKVWHDYKNVSFGLKLNGANIDIRIEDSDNVFDCDQRSDGFKRFVTFLLALSAPVNNGEIKDAIIIIDEPDLGIHILGQKNLLQELIKISKDNLVFYSSHSIFMIDRDEPSRHFIVEKKNEITTIKQATESNYTDDEVLFRALGYSIFEALKPQNIIFEGWSDKRIFEVAQDSRKRGKKDWDFGNIGKVHSTGASQIANIAKTLELADRKCCIIGDSDERSVQEKKRYIEMQCVGVWYMYEDFVPGVYTLEDFIYHDSFKESIEAARKNHEELEVFDFFAFKTHIYKREEFIKSWIKLSIKDSERIKAVLKEIKSHLYSNIEIRDIEDTYFKFLTLLKSKNSI